MWRGQKKCGTAMTRSERETVALLGDAILLDPAHGRALLKLADFHELMSKSKGSVFLRGHIWRIEPERFNNEYVRVRLRRV